MNAETLYVVKMVLPEMVLVAAGLLVLAVDLLLPRGNGRKGLAVFAALACLFVAGLAARQWMSPSRFAPTFVRQELTAAVQAGQDAFHRAVLDNRASLEMNNRQYELFDNALYLPEGRLTNARARKMVAAYHILRAERPELPPLNLGIRHPGTAVWWLCSGDAFAAAFKVIFALAAFLVLLLSVRYPVERYRGEFAALLLFATTGLMVMVSSLDLVVLFLGLELASVCLYVLAAWHKGDARSAEAGTKYLLLASLASAFYIYGASLLFVKFGSTNLHIIAHSLNGAQPLVLIGLLMLMVGFAFKVSAAPFHLWAPDVYQGAPISTVAFLSTASKAAGFAVLLRVLTSGFFALSAQWWQIVGVMAGLSMLVGNLIALHQNNVKRMLAYSGIAQAGYILIAVTALGLGKLRGVGEPGLGMTAAILYLFLYTVGNIGAFAITGIVSREAGHAEMSAFAGLRWRAPLLAFAMLLLLLSLGGIPLLAGFVGKWYIFLSGVYQGQYPLVLLGAILSVVSIYYYLLVIKQMYIMEAPKEAPAIRVGALAATGLSVIIILTIAIGIYPKPFLDLARITATSLLGY